MAPPGALEPSAVTDTEGITIPNPLTAPLKINEINGRRTAPSKTQWGVAAPSTSDQFKQRKDSSKPIARRWDHYLTQETQSRKGSSLKGAARFLSTPGLISLGGGLPSSEYFPFDSMSVKVPVPGHFSEEETHEHGVVLTAGKHDLADEKSIFDIATAFNYGQGSGAAQLLRYITEHTELVHKPPYQDWHCTMTIGSTSGLDMVLRMFTERGDLVLSEEYTFATAIDTMAPLGVKVVGIKMDEQGLLPDSMDEILSNWNPLVRDGSRKPRLLYTVPTGQNPTGATQSLERRQAIYKVCQKHDIVIVEDEPYYFLQMQPYNGPDAPDAPLPTSHDEFLRALVPSYLSMDVDGRVFRMDSVSKILGPGFRLGWVTASEQIVARFKKHADLSTQAPSGLSQLVLFKLLDEHWGHAGFLDWLLHIRVEYTKRRNVILDACEKHLPKEAVSWTPPMAGMFHWMKINWQKHPQAGKKTLNEIEEEIFLSSINHGVMVMCGSWFTAEKDAVRDTLFMRATYAAAPSDKINEAIRRFGEALRNNFGLTNNGANGHTE